MSKLKHLIINYEKNKYCGIINIIRFLIFLIFMKPKITILILIIVVIACGLFMVYLADTMKLEENYKNTILEQQENNVAHTKSEQDKIKEQAEIAEQERLELLQTLDEKKKNNPDNIDFAARENIRLELLKSLDDQKIKNN